MRRSRAYKVGLILAVATCAAVADRAGALVTSNLGLDMANVINLTPLYNQGYTGTRSAVAVIDAGFCSPTHPSLASLGTSLTLYTSTSLVTSPYTNWVDLHGTETSFAAAGRGANSASSGIAYGAKLLSGAIASSWVTSSSSGSYNLGFSASYQVIGQTLYQAAVSGVTNPVGGTPSSGTADVLSLSWSFGTATANGNELAAGLVDAVAWSGSKLICAAAGNDGPNSNTVGAPASGFNSLAVAAVGSEFGVPAYSTVSNFSSRGLNDVWVPKSGVSVGTTGTQFGSVVTGVRARVDIAAPGEGLTLANYSGRTGGATNPNYTPPTGDYLSNQAGTSFATPIVAGVATLLADVARDRLASTTTALDGRVMKAVLMNSATKQAGWSNSAFTVNGVYRTTQSLDLNVGAGIVNGGAAMTQLVYGNTDLAGTTGGTISSIGWDYGAVTSVAGSSNDYTTALDITAGSKVTITLSWFANDLINTSRSGALWQSFFNLDLQLYRVSAVDSSLTLVADSISQYNSSEQIYIPSLSQSGKYLIRVVDTGANWNFTAGTTQVPYGLAWSFGPGGSFAVVPEPGMLGVLVPVGLLLGRPRGRGRNERSEGRVSLRVQVMG